MEDTSYQYHMKIICQNLISVPPKIYSHKSCLLILQLFYKAAYNKTDYNNMNSHQCGCVH